MGLFEKIRTGEISCACGARYERFTVELPVKDTDDFSCEVCGTQLASWYKTRHVPNHTLISRGPDMDAKNNSETK